LSATGTSGWSVVRGAQWTGGIVQALEGPNPLRRSGAEEVHERTRAANCQEGCSNGAFGPGVVLCSEPCLGNRASRSVEALPRGVPDLEGQARPLRLGRRWLRGRTGRQTKGKFTLSLTSPSSQIDRAVRSPSRRRGVSGYLDGAGCVPRPRPTTTMTRPTLKRTSGPRSEKRSASLGAISEDRATASSSRFRRVIGFASPTIQLAQQGGLYGNTPCLGFRRILPLCPAPPAIGLATDKRARPESEALR
jgi:hypothetical protein